ncbi:MAG: elongation factor P [Candidatus Hatepunaea meridiana]|nr:elongation factor P [Candidatus Hatepunaea meridiana]
MSTTADIKNGIIINYDGQLFTIVEFLHVKPGKGGAFVRTKFKNVKTGRVLDKTFRAGEKIDIVRLDARNMQYLYAEGDDFVFMDQETFDQISVPAEVVGNWDKFMKEGEIVKVLLNGEEPVTIELPKFVNYKIAQCEPGVKGDTVSNVTKPATLETGAIVQVPLFIEEGEIIRVDLRTGQYLERAK